MVLRWGVRRYILSIKICVCSYFTAEGTNRRCGEETLCFPSKSSCLPKDENITKNVEIGGAFISVNFYLAQKSSTFVSIRAVLNLASGLVFFTLFCFLFWMALCCWQSGPKAGLGSPARPGPGFYSGALTCTFFLNIFFSKPVQKRDFFRRVPSAPGL